MWSFRERNGIRDDASCSYGLAGEDGRCGARGSVCVRHWSGGVQRMLFRVETQWQAGCSDVTLSQ